MKFGEAMKAARLAAGKTQAEVAAELGLSRPYICDLESDRRGPLRPELLQRLAEYLGTDSERLRESALESLGWL